MALAPASRDSAVAWTRTTLPRTPTLIRFRWRYQDERVKYAGRGSTRIARPDSLRFDFAGPFNLGNGAAVVIGDSVAWADPEKNFRSLVPAIPMLWAAFAMVRPPANDARVLGGQLVDSVTHKRRVFWRFAQVEDTLDYVVTDSGGRESLLEAEWRRRGAVVARSRSQLDALRRPASARVDFPEAPARFELTVGVVDTAAVIPPNVWRSRR
ncbi:MAG: hypothetical protein DMD64_02230 [Gemmatimonadetes bacterium]|nr:MAG: hypothetical protein DMD64_02230 [Gemmatimonadota bacterium]